MKKNNVSQPQVENSFSNQIFSSKWAIAIVSILLLITGLIYFAPSLNDKTLPAHDFQQGVAMATQLAELHKQTGETAKWAINSFSGMPAFQIWMSYDNLSSWISTFILDSTNAYFFIVLLLSIGASVLFYSMGAHPIIVFIGGISLIFSNFTIISLMAGHNNKVLVMSMVPLTLAGIWMLYERKKYLLSLFIISLSIAIQIRLNHVQITYFMFFLIGVWSLYNLFKWIKQKDFKHLLLSIIIMILGVGLGGANNLTQIIANKEYSEETQRGGPTEVELSKKTEQVKSDGLDYEYATAWSYGILETFTLLIPNFSGGPDHSREIKESNAIVQALTSKGVPASNAFQLAEQLPTYWGAQPFVAGTTYLGAIVIFLMFIGFFLLKTDKKWWLLGSLIITLMVAWGDNFSTFYKLLFNYLPLFNKFRTPTMIFYLTTIIVVITAVLTLQHIVQQAQNRELLWKNFFKVSLGFIGFMIFITVLGTEIFSFTSPLDENLRTQLLQMTQNNNDLTNGIMNGLIQERKSLLRADAFRSLILIFLTFLAIAAFLKRKISSEIMLAVIAVLVLIDVVGVDKRYVKYDTFVDNSAAGADGPVANAADKFILQDTTLSYRVLDLSVNTFNDAKPSYFHKNVGGYHSAKLKRYQDIISYQIQHNLQQVSQGNIAKANVLNMLNTKYLITSPQAEGVYVNTSAYGNAWLVSEVKVLNGPVEVFEHLMTEDLKTTALLEKPSEKITSNQTLPIDSSASIQLVQSSNDVMVYSYQSNVPAYAVFSEIYYNSGKGWSAYIDDQEVPHDQVNYVLRGLSLPEGKHTITFKFDTPVLQKTQKVDFASSIIILLLGIGSIILPFYQRSIKR